MRAVLGVVLALLDLTAGVSYEGYKVFKINPENDRQMEQLMVFRNDTNFDFWSKLNRVGNPVSIMVAPKVQNNFVKYLKGNEIPYEILIENVESTIQAEKRRKKVGQAGRRITLDEYHRHDEINAYLEEIAEDFADIAATTTIGKSYEGRDLKLIHISTDRTAQKPVIFVDAGIHAREWIAPALAIYLISELVENPDQRKYIEDVDWIIFPNVNPDGYEYTWDEDRLWRKTRTPGRICEGVDANRNFDFHWMDVGASDYECDETYAGPEPFSEVEAQALSNYLLNATNIKLYLTLHSYGPYLLYPWGYNSDLPDNWEELDDLGNAVNDAIRAVRGTEYEVGSSTRVLYAASGASDDWSMGVAGINLVYTIELPGGGWYGFDLPPSEILNVTVETFEGIKVYHDYVVKNAK